MSKQGKKLDKGNFTVEVKYSPEAVDKKLIKFTVIEGNEIVLSADELVSMLVNQVNSEVLSATFVESDRINVVEVGRQIQCQLDKDLKKGEIININYTHPYPIEFALIEEAWKIAQIKKDTKVTEITAEYIESVKKQIKPDMEKYIRKFYESFKSLNLKKTMQEEETKIESPVEETVAQEEVVEKVDGETVDMPETVEPTVESEEVPAE